MSTSHHILLVTRNFPPLLGGMERLNQHLLEELERNYAVHLVGPQGAAEHVAYPERVSTCPSAPVYAFLACAALKAVRSARRHRPGLIIAGSGVNAPPACTFSSARHGITATPIPGHPADDEFADDRRAGEPGRGASRH
jgi:phosphatidylinositol alpha-1,6-mannosyltransferase